MTDPVLPCRTRPADSAIWVLRMPFKKNGFPVVGSFSAKTEGVVIMKLADWTAMWQRGGSTEKRRLEVSPLLKTNPLPAGFEALPTKWRKQADDAMILSTEHDHISDGGNSHAF